MKNSAHIEEPISNSDYLEKMSTLPQIRSFIALEIAEAVMPHKLKSIEQLPKM